MTSKRLQIERAVASSLEEYVGKNKKLTLTMLTEVRFAVKRALEKLVADGVLDTMPKMSFQVQPNGSLDLFIDDPELEEDSTMPLMQASAGTLCNVCGGIFETHDTFDKLIYRLCDGRYVRVLHDVA